MNAEIFAALRQLEKERGIPVDYMVEKITQALVAAYKKDRDGYTDNVYVELTEDAMRMYAQKEVVDEVITPATEVTLDAARKVDPHAQLGDLVNVEIKTQAFGRIAAQTAKQLSELLAEENNSLWSAVLYGISVGDGEIVTVALSQVGNVGGQPYWSWYGFDGRVEWCACFVSWCANECGYIESGVIPKFAGCANGVQWFKDRGQWQDGSFKPSAGQIIFFDWDNKGSSGPQDGQSDHVGIVEKCENGIVYTIEGNSGDSCRQNQYPVGHYEILGYGIPAF